MKITFRKQRLRQLITFLGFLNIIYNLVDNIYKKYNLNIIIKIKSIL